MINVATTDFNPLIIIPSQLKVPYGIFKPTKRKLNITKNIDSTIRFISFAKKFKMANTYHQVYIQVVFAVKYRNAVIEEK